MVACLTLERAMSGKLHAYSVLRITHSIYDIVKDKNMREQTV